MVQEEESGAESNGFKVEGGSPETLYFNGRYHDELVMGVLRKDFEKRER